MFLNSRFLANFYKYKRKFSNYTQKFIVQQRTITTQVVGGTTGNGQHMKILFFGTDNFSLPSLKALHKNRIHDVENVNLGVVTSFKMPSNCVRVYAEQQRLPLLRWPITADACAQYDLGVVVSFGHLIPAKLIQAFPLGMINVHASLLPHWRGAAPIIYSLMHGDATTGVSVMRIEPKHFDIGDILAQRKVQIKDNILMPELHAQLASEGASLLIDVVNAFPEYLKNAKKQDDTAATFAPKITPAITEIAWTKWHAQQLYNRYRALYGFKHLNTTFQRQNVQLIDIKMRESAAGTGKLILENTCPGTFVYDRQSKSLLVHCVGNSTIEIHQLRLEGKKIMSAIDFNNGFLKKLKTDVLCFTENKTASC